MVCERFKSKVLRRLYKDYDWYEQKNNNNCIDNEIKAKYDYADSRVKWYIHRLILDVKNKMRDTDLEQKFICKPKERKFKGMKL